MCVCRCFFPLPADDGGSGKSLFHCGSLTRHIGASVESNLCVHIYCRCNFFLNVPKNKQKKLKKGKEIEKKKKYSGEQKTNPFIFILAHLSF